jgi:arabinofuranosyltransferase
MLMVLFVGVTPPFIYLTYGMESTLLIMLCALLLCAYQANKMFWVGVFAGLLCITRSEGVLLPLFVLFDYVLKNKRLPHIKYFIAPILFIGASYSFNYFYYGHFLPDSASAKLGQGKSGLWGSGWLFLKYSGYLKSWAFHSNNLYVIACFACGVLGLWQFRLTMMTRVIVPYLLAYVAVCTAAGVPNYHWYYTPLFAFGSVYAALGVIALLQHRRGLVGKWLGMPVAIILGIYILYWGCLYSNQPAGPHEPYRQIGLWIKQNTAPSAKIAMVEIGTVGWYSERHIIDILGLVTPLNAEFIAERKFSEWLNHYSPDYILLHEPLLSHEQSANDPRIANGYRPDSRFQYSGYKLLKKLGV